MRWKGFIAVFILISVTILISLFFMDRWIESGLEKTAAAIIGAKVEIDGLDFRLSDLSIQWDRLQVTDPKNTMQNWIETGHVEFDMHLPALLRKRVVIETMTLANLRSGTPRQSDGALPKKRTAKGVNEKPSIFEKTAQILEKESDQLPIMHVDINALKRKVNVDSLIVLADLKTPGHLDSARADLNRLSERWKSFYLGFHPEEDLQKIQDDLRNIDLKKAKNLTEITAILTKAESARNTLNTLSRTIDTKYSEAREDFRRLDIYETRVKEWIESDYQSLLQLAKMPDLSAKGVSKMVFGVAILVKVDRYLDVLQKIRKVIPKHTNKTKKEKRPRLKGQTVHFLDRHGWPSLLIKKATISGRSGEHTGKLVWNYNGEMIGFTTQPAVYGKPTVLNVEGQKENQEAAYIWALLDHTTEMIKDTLHISVSNIVLNGISLPETPFFPSNLRNGKADLNLSTRIRDDSLYIRIDITTKDIAFEEKKNPSEDLITGIIQTAFLNMKRFRIRIEIISTHEDFTLKIASDLDDLVSHELKKRASDALLRTEQAIRNRLNQLVGSETSELNGLFISEREAHQNPIQEYKNQTDILKEDFQNTLNEIKNKIEKRKKEQGDKLEDKAQKLLDDLFKK